MAQELASDFIARKEMQFASERNKELQFKDIGREGRHNWIREAWTFQTQHDLDEKVFVIERLRSAGKLGRLTHSIVDGDIQYRIGYWIVGRNRNRKGKWTWGQYCPLIPALDLGRLIKNARDRGTIRSEDWIF